MASASDQQLNLAGKPMKKVHRKSYTREFKLSIIALHHSHNLYQTSKYKLNTKTILWWAASEMEISKSTKGSKHCHKHRRPDHPEMEAAILELQLLEPEHNFKFSSGRFEASLRRATNITQKPATDKFSELSQHHQKRSKTIRW